MRKAKHALGRADLVVLCASAVVVLLSHAAFILFPSEWGGPNIGGGLLLGAGYVGLFVGAALFVKRWRRGRGSP